MASNAHWIGQSVLRKEGREKVCGSAKYVDDISFSDLLYGATVRSTIPRGKIKSIRFGKNVPWDEFTIVTAQDIPGANCVALLIDDQPCLAEGIVNHPEEAIVLLAHPDKYLLEEARRAVQVEFEPLPAIFTIADSLAKKQIIWGEDNIFKSFLVEKGDVEHGLAEADLIVEGEYDTGAQEQLYIEPQGMIARANAAEGVTVWGSLQCPYYVHKALGKIFHEPAHRIRVVQNETGGGFGGKEEYPSMIAAHAGLLALKSGKAVKIIYDRAEDMVATTKRHPSHTRHRTGVTLDGKLVAMDIDFSLDGGAYETLSPVVLSRGTIHAAGPYLCPHVRVRSRVVATNTAPHGAFRGFGAPQSIFALERHMDRIAVAVGLSREQFRRRNFIHQGETLAVSQVVRDEVKMDLLMDRAFELSDYHRKRAEFEAQPSNAPVRKGIGFASFMHGAGFTGSGEQYLASEAAAEATPEGRVQVLAGSTEMGQGTNTIFAQIAAEALHLPYDQIDILQPDTARVPNSGPTVASRTTMIVGKLVETASQQISRQLIEAGLIGENYGSEDFSLACREFIASRGPLKGFAKYKQPDDIHWDDKLYRGDAYGAYGWAVYVAEVSVDLRTAETRVENFVAVQDVGRVVNPTLASGQIEGGVAQGIGFALYENIIWKDGRMLNGQMTNYIMPTSMDLPPIRVLFEEVPYERGPGGAKGIGELPLDGTAPAVANAVAHATGMDIRAVPLTPEQLATMVWSARA